MKKTSKKSLVDRVRQLCQSKDVLLTPQRRLVLEVISEGRKPYKAYQILQKMNSEQPPVVYRALNFLLEHGLVHKINTLNAYIACLHPHKNHSCYLIICRQCGDVEECCNQSLAKNIKKVTSRHDFQLQEVALEILGLCCTCQKLK